MTYETACQLEKFNLTEYGSTVKTDCVYEVLIHNVKNRLDFEATAIFHKYPNYTDMMGLFRQHDIKVSDFKDINSCMKDRVVFGEAYNVCGKRSTPKALYTIERIQGSATKFEELLR